MCLSIKVNNPRLVLAEGSHSGFEWIVTHNDLGYRCGYMKVEQGHPWHGKNLWALDCSVHGGVTFSESDTPCKADGPDTGWWIGFDCAHLGDKRDADLIEMSSDAEHIRDWMRKFPEYFDSTTRSQQYVEGQCRRLCDQALHAAGSPP